jgi:hypothetical protein
MTKPTARVLVGVMICLLARSGGACAYNAPQRNGEELLAFDPDTITELSVQADGLRLIAHRWDLESPFHIGIFTRTGIASCVGGGGFMQVLRALRSLQAVRMLSDFETRQLHDRSASAIRLRFIATTEIDLGDWTFYLPAQTGRPIAVQSENMGRAAELPIGRQPFVLLSEGCHALGKSP